MKIIYNDIFLEHDTGMHPENAKRILAIKQYGELRQTPLSEMPDATKYLKLIHSKEYIAKVKEYCTKSEQLDHDTVTSSKTYDAAVAAVAATIYASECGGFAIVRPPGHHAHPDNSSGFCIFNNIAIAAQKLANEGKRVLLFDFDGHLGDGTEKIFYNSKQVMYFSLHQFPAFPGGGDATDIGDGQGRGYTINIPLPPESGDDIFKEALDRFITVAEQFKPDIVALSAGFDGHQHDLLLNLRLSVNAYYDLGKFLSARFKNIFGTLEGGYNVELLPKCLFNFLAGINAENKPFNEEATDSRIQVMDEAQARMAKLERTLKPYWKI